MYYNADAYLAALEPPKYTHHGCTYYGRVLSFDQWVALTRHLDLLSTMLRKYASLDELAAAKGYVQFRVSMRRIVDAVFPKRCPVDVPEGATAPTRGWIIKRPARVSDLIDELPLEAQCAAVRGFTRSQEQRQSVASPGETTTTPQTPPPPPSGSPPTTETTRQTQEDPTTP
jgi:hypothetical protein